MLYAELDPFEPVAIQEHDAGDGWRVFFRSATNRDRARSALAAEFGNALLALSSIDVDDEDWARRSQASLTAIRVGRIVVAPPWTVNPSSLIANPESLILESSNPESLNPESANREPQTASRETDDIVIVIDPSTGFGTGHHASTRLCLELLQRIDLNGKRVVDVGTGSGVLAIAAWRLGARGVTAIDNDPDALANARDNIDRNGAHNAVVASEIDLSTASLDPADLVVANLTGAILQRHASSLRRLTPPKGELIVSGFTTDEEQDVLRAFGVEVRESAQEGDWVALRLKNP